jgi:hypothetical protein
MKPKRVKRYSKVAKALAYLRDFGRGHISVYDPESLRQAVHTMTNYIEVLEGNSTEATRRQAVQDTEKLLDPGQMRLTLAEPDKFARRE